MIAKSNKYKKSSKRDVFFSILILILFFAIIGFLIKTNLNIREKKVELQEQINVLEKEIKDYEEKVANLKANISGAETKDYQTERLYEEGYFEEGAVPVVVLPAEEEEEKELETVKEEETSLESYWQEFLRKARAWYNGITTRQ